MSNYQNSLNIFIAADFLVIILYIFHLISSLNFHNFKDLEVYDEVDHNRKC